MIEEIRRRVEEIQQEDPFRYLSMSEGWSLPGERCGQGPLLKWQGLASEDGLNREAVQLPAKRRGGVLSRIVDSQRYMFIFPACVSIAASGGRSRA